MTGTRREELAIKIKGNKLKNSVRIGRKVKTGRNGNRAIGDSGDKEGKGRIAMAKRVRA